MGKLHLSVSVTLDGFVTDDDGGMDWIIMGDERAAYESGVAVARDVRRDRLQA